MKAIHPDGGTAERALAELRKAVDGADLLTAARQAVARIDAQADIIYCLKQRLSRYEEVE